MTITDREIPLGSIISVYDGRIRRERCGCDCRASDGFVFVLSGKARYDFSYKSLCVGPGDVLYLPKGGCYSITLVEREYRFIWVDFLFALPQERAAEGEVYHPGGGKAVENAFVKLLNLWRMGDFSDKLLCKAIFYEIYAGIMKAAALKELSADSPDRLTAVAQYIQEHYADADLSVERLAELYGTSSVRFRRVFAQRYRTGPQKYITALRMARARELLAGTDLSISEICGLCGYNSVYYFDRVFKKEFGVQPLQFRRRSL
jgi:AraC-like DNA-binding protein